MRKTFYQIAESVISSMQGGVFSDETNIDMNMTLSKINEARGIIAMQKWNTIKKVHPDWLQRFYPTYDEDIQEKCHILFRVPGIIDLDKHSDGMQYVGSRDYTNSFRKIADRNTWSTILNHGVMSSRAKLKGSYLYEAGDMEIYFDLKVRDLMVVSVFSDPRDIPTYNIEKDPYPVDAASVEMIEEIVRNKIIMMNEKTPSDAISDSQDKK